MKKIKNIVLMLSTMILTVLVSCKKEEPKPVINFNNPTAQYIESFLGKSVDEFKRACEESSLMFVKEEKISENKTLLIYENSINGLQVGIYYFNNVNTNIRYTKKGEIESNKKTFNNFLDFLIKNNYAAFKGYNSEICYKDIKEYKNSLENRLSSENIFVKSTNGVYSKFDSNEIMIEFTASEDDEFEEIKANAMSSCD